MRNSKWFSAALASAILVAGGAGSIAATSSSANAATVKTAAVKESSMTWSVNGTPVALSTINSGGYKLYSLNQVAGELGAKLIISSSGFELNDSKGLHNVIIKAGAKGYQVDGAAQQFTVAPVIYNGKAYVELTKLVTALGGELQAEDQTILSFARPEGQFDTLHWNADGSIIANKSDSETAQLFKFNAYPGDYEIFSSNSSASDFAVSADQKWGAFTDETGQLKLINLASGAISSLGTDTSVKTDLVWSADGKTIYFIQGDKQEKIAQISVETGVVKAVLEDKVENKSELRLSSDARAVVYIDTVTGVTKTDADSTEDSLTVDFSKAGEQIYKLDLAAKDAKPRLQRFARDSFTLRHTDNHPRSPGRTMRLQHLGHRLQTHAPRHRIDRRFSDRHGQSRLRYSAYPLAAVYLYAGVIAPAHSSLNPRLMRRIRVISGILHCCTYCRFPAAALTPGQLKRMPEAGRQIDLHARRGLARDQQERSTFGGCGSAGACGVATAQRCSGTADSGPALSQLCRSLAPLRLCYSLALSQLCRSLAPLQLCHSLAPLQLCRNMAPLQLCHSLAPLQLCRNMAPLQLWLCLAPLQLRCSLALVFRLQISAVLIVLYTL
ncbi:hypothetical protein AMQ83_25550 [Paenibacillus riograndensis]|nr:hypothetical protein AMQ83_25550 [Paenibacillus riograndensis]